MDGHSLLCWPELSFHCRNVSDHGETEWKRCGKQKIYMQACLLLHYTLLSLFSFIMGVSTAERNRRKRERKKREKEQRRRQEEEFQAATERSKEGRDKTKREDEIEIDYVVEPLSLPATEIPKASTDGMPGGLPSAMGGTDAHQEESMESVLRRFNQRAAVSSAVVSDEEMRARQNNRESSRSPAGSSDEESDNEEKQHVSRRKMREILRPSVAELKRRVKRPDLVEAHDITASDPDFLIELKSIAGTVQVPRHWGRKR